MTKAWTLTELHEKPAEFERELVAAELRPSSVRTYVDRIAVFLRWLAGEYHPRGPVE